MEQQVLWLTTGTLWMPYGESRNIDTTQSFGTLGTPSRGKMMLLSNDPLLEGHLPDSWHQRWTWHYFRRTAKPLHALLLRSCWSRILGLFLWPNKRCKPVCFAKALLKFVVALPVNNWGDIQMCTKNNIWQQIPPSYIITIAGIPFSILRENMSSQSFTCSAQPSDVVCDSSLFVLLEGPVSLMTVFDVPV